MSMIFIRKSNLLTPRCFSFASTAQCHNGSIWKNSDKNNNSPTDGKVKGALAGIKVLDLTRILAGPFCTMMLADLGADVIKVERPGVGDETRQWGPPYVKDQSCYFLAVNRNKKSISVDLKNPAGLEIIKKLASRCDIFVENYLPGKLEHMGLGYEAIKKLNPNVIYASVTGFGSDGPYTKRAGFDVIAASMGGLLSITGPENGEPCKVGVAITDMTTGLFANSSILAALHQREKTGSGCKVEANLLSSQVAVLANLGINYLNCGVKAPRRGTAHETVVPYQAFKCKGGKWITIGAGSNKMFEKLCVLAFPEKQAKEMIADERFKTNAKRAENRTLLIELLNEQFVEQSVDYWIKTFTDSGIAYVIDVHHDVTGDIKLLGPATKLYAASPDVTSFREGNTAPPLLGEHTVEVLTDILGYDSNEVKKMEASGAIHCYKPQ
ncbi:Succinate--hydroxymethylglutarate CoA-transferase [Halotydeus destructor]|nr:Succinate--hydroxymethylglutarate CoA-transferase [Halotydeus destructor]